MDKDALEARMRMYYDLTVDWETLESLKTGLTVNAAAFDARKARQKLLATEQYQSANLRRYALRPFETRWCYYSSVRPLWNSSRPTLWAQCWQGNSFLLTRFKAARDPEGSPYFFTTFLSDDHFLSPDAVAIPLRLRATSTQNEDSEQNHFFAAEEPNDAPTANLSSKSRAYLSALGIDNPDADADTAALVWMHALAIGYAPAYLSENADGIRNDWPRVPLPSDADALHRSAQLGRTVAAILAYDAANVSHSSAPPQQQQLLRGITTPPLRAEMKIIGVVSRAGGGQLKIGEGELALNANWGFATRKGGVMPGKGKTVERAYTDAERDAIERGASALGLSATEAFKHLGETTRDVYLNDVAYWRNIPVRIWDYHIGGYQVIKKWLSYREHDLLKRDLTPAETGEVSTMARRIAALLLLEPALDANYQAVKQTAYAWPS